MVESRMRRCPRARSPHSCSFGRASVDVRRCFAAVCMCVCVREKRMCAHVLHVLMPMSHLARRPSALCSSSHDTHGSIYVRVVSWSVQVKTVEGDTVRILKPTAMDNGLKGAVGKVLHVGTSSKGRTQVGPRIAELAGSGRRSIPLCDATGERQRGRHSR